MRIALPQDLTQMLDQADRLRHRLASIDVGRASTQLVGGALILTSSFLVVTNPDTGRSTDSSAVVAARIAPVGTVQLAATPDVTVGPPLAAIR